MITDLKIKTAMYTLMLYLLENDQTALEGTFTLEDSTSITVELKITNMHDRSEQEEQDD